MKIEDLKSKIESNNIDDESFIFVVKKSRFLADQYVNAIAKIKGLTIVYREEYSMGGFFDFLEDGNLYVYATDEFNLTPRKNYVIITKKSNNEDAIVFPELEPWQIKDYVYSVCSGAEESILDNLISGCKDYYFLENEIEKLSIFDEKIRNSLSKDFLDDGVFGIESVDTFDFINAVQRRDIDAVKSLYGGYEKDAMSFIGLMYKQFRNMISVYLNPNPTEQNTGLKSNQIYAIKKVCQSYSKQQVLDIFKFLTELDIRLKKGELPTENLFDYVLVNVLTK